MFGKQTLLTLTAIHRIKITFHDFVSIYLISKYIIIEQFNFFSDVLRNGRSVRSVLSDDSDADRRLEGLAHTDGDASSFLFDCLSCM